MTALDSAVHASVAAACVDSGAKVEVAQAHRVLQGFGVE